MALPDILEKVSSSLLLLPRSGERETEPISRPKRPPTNQVRNYQNLSMSDEHGCPLCSTGHTPISTVASCFVVTELSTAPAGRQKRINFCSLSILSTTECQKKKKNVFRIQACAEIHTEVESISNI